MNCGFGFAVFFRYSSTKKLLFNLRLWHNLGVVQIFVHETAPPISIEKAVGFKREQLSRPTKVRQLFSLLYRVIV